MLPRVIGRARSHGRHVPLSLQFARRFYIAQWLRDCSKEIETKTKKMSEDGRNSNSRTSTPKNQRPKSRSKKPKKPKPRNSRRLEEDDDDEEEDEVDSEETEEEDYEEECEESRLAKKTSNELEWLKVAQMEIEKRKKFLFKEAASFKTFTSSIRSVYIVCLIVEWLILLLLLLLLLYIIIFYTIIHYYNILLLLIIIIIY